MKILPGHALIGFFFLLNLLIAVSPLITMTNQKFGDELHDWFHMLCHQRNTRSYCMADGFWIGDCLESPEKFSSERTPLVIDSGKIKYKFMVCSRDIGIYAGMLFGLVLFWKRKGIQSLELMSFWVLVASIIPTGIDGTLQLVSELGINIPIIGSYESLNFVRLTTGLLAGVGTGYAMIPLANAFMVGKEKKQEEQQKEAPKSASEKSTSA